MGVSKQRPEGLPPITVARKAMISESPVNTFIEIGVRPPPLYFRQSFAPNPTVEIRVGRSGDEMNPADYARMAEECSRQAEERAAPAKRHIVAVAV